MDYSKLKTIGVWVDDNFNKIDQHYVDACKECHINSVSFMVNKSNATTEDPGWELRYSKYVFKAVADLFNKNNISVTLTAWPRPDKTQIDTMCKDINELMTLTQAKVFQIDAESNWDSKFLKGFKNMKEAADYLVAKMKATALLHNVQISLTTFPYHSENSKNATISQYMDILYPQAYSVANRTNGKIKWTDAFGPKNMQKITYDRAKATKIEPSKIGCGLAAYDQKWDGHTEEEAMKLALDTAIELGIEHVCYWSSKWIVGSSKTNYGNSFLKKLK